MFLLLAACVESGTKDSADPAGSPDLSGPSVVVTPTAIDFGSVPVGSSAEETVVVSNVGDEALRVLDLRLEGPDVFTVSTMSAVLVEPGGSATFTVAFTPVDAGDVSGLVLLHTDDPVDAEVPVSLTAYAGDALAAFLPSPVVLPTVDVGCAASAAVALANQGDADLVLESWSTTAGYTLTPVEALGDAPWTIRGGDSVGFVVTHEVGTAGATGTTIHATTSVGDVSADVIGQGIALESHSATFEVPPAPQLDVIFTVDRSEGTDDEVSRFSTQLDGLVDALLDRGVDYQLTIVQADDGCPLGDVPYVTPAMPVDEQVDTLTTLLGTEDDAGSNTERGFTILEAATTEENLAVGGCNEGLVRDEARLAMVGFTDEVEQSANSWTYYVGLFQSYEDDPDDLVVHAIAGDYPSGCDDNEPGRGWYEASVDTGGAYVSVCLTDYSPAFDALAEAAAVVRLSLDAEDVDPSTIGVTVDGVRATGWTWVDARHEVRFDTPPPGGSEVVVTWTELPECG